VSITAGNNYAKQKQFRRLQAKIDESTVEVIRNGSVRHIDSKEVVVGDLLLFRIGNMFTIDGIFIQYLSGRAAYFRK
jgi:magnesium-transporting ATPase (P-type)